MSGWFRKNRTVAPTSGAPPEGVSGSEQSVENERWRVQLDLATGGARSLLLRGRGGPCELADPDAAVHPFQAVWRDPAGGRTTVSQFIRSRFRFDHAGASLAVDATLAGGVWTSTFRVRAGEPVLSVDLEWGGLAPGSLLEMALPLAMPGVTLVFRGARGQPVRGVAELSGASGSAQATIRAD
jgi:hypothetical protein